jgi:DNA-binding FadR family transcriptional regulator
MNSGAMQEPFRSDHLSEFMRFLAFRLRGNERVPPLTELSQELGVSVASLREQLEVARALGLVEVRPKTGIRRLPFNFRPGVEQGLAYAIAVEPENFGLYADFRKHVEEAYWYEAVERLQEDDRLQLRYLVTSAKEKLSRAPVQIPHWEHRELHLGIYRRLENPFVLGVMEAYWSMYEMVGLDVYTDLDYLQTVWDYHQKMVGSICEGNFSAGYQYLVEHMDLLRKRNRNSTRQIFE